MRCSGELFPKSFLLLCNLLVFAQTAWTLLSLFIIRASLVKTTSIFFLFPSFLSKSHVIQHFYYKLLLGYIHYVGGFKMTILIRFILYIIYICPIFLPLSPLPTLPKAIARGFVLLFHIGIQSLSTITLISYLHPPPSH
jgi:hypothetical protein